MRATWRALRRARGRTAASVLALALAVAAIGVFAVPAVTQDSLRRIAADDRLAHITLDTTPIPDPAALAGNQLGEISREVGHRVPCGEEAAPAEVPRPSFFSKSSAAAISR